LAFRFQDLGKVLHTCQWLSLDREIVFRGRRIGPEETALIQEVVQADWVQGRNAISREVCRRWDWRQASGYLREIS
jgi:hypothetical protein